MSDPVFDLAFATVLAHEGGYVDDPADAGGATCYGISQREYPGIEIASLTVDQAKAIYYRDFWAKFRIGTLPGVRLPVKVMDIAVLAGPHTAIMVLQRAINACGARVDIDGVVGPHTIEACRSASTEALLAMYRELLVSHFAQIVADNPNDERFAAGWRTRALA